MDDAIQDAKMLTLQDGGLGHTTSQHSNSAGSVLSFSPLDVSTAPPWGEGPV